MSYIRRFPVLALLLAAACSDGTAPVAPRQQEPHFLRWSATAAPRFEAIGAAAQGAAFLGSRPLFNLAGDTTLAVNAYEASFWAVRGQSRTIQINYVSGDNSSPFLSFTASDPTYVPGLGELALGDSVLLTVQVERQNVAAHFEPSGLQFGTPSSLTFWYGGVGGDLNGDGDVDGIDAYIEQKVLGMWYQASLTSPWTPMAATRSLTEKSFTASIAHFSGYAVSW